MPKVGTLDYTINTEYPQSYELWYSQKKKFEIKGVDEEFFNLTGILPYFHNTEQELHTAILCAITVYREKKKAQRLVIGYLCQTSNVLRMNEEKRGRYQGTLPGVSSKIGDLEWNVPYCSIGITYNVYLEIADGHKNTYYEVDDNMKAKAVAFRPDSQYQFIDYSEERYQFFENIKSGMQGMVQKMSMFFDLDSEQATMLIESTPNLLLGS